MINSHCFLTASTVFTRSTTLDRLTQDREFIRSKRKHLSETAAKENLILLPGVELALGRSTMLRLFSGFSVSLTHTTPPGKITNQVLVVGQRNYLGSLLVGIFWNTRRRIIMQFLFNSLYKRPYIFEHLATLSCWTSNITDPGGCRSDCKNDKHTRAIVN